MYGVRAEEYLHKYKSQSEPILVSYLEKSMKEAELFGKVNFKAIQQFNRIALGGKRIRGALVLLGYELAGGKISSNVIKASLTMELFHAALLVHDDIMDKAENRRNITTIHSSLVQTLGSVNALHDAYSIAMCVGDAVFYYAWDQLMSANMDCVNVSSAAKIFIHYAKRVAYGQMQDVVLSRQKTASKKMILEMMYLKSGEYTCELPLMFGAELAGGMVEKHKRALLKYAQSLGWLFQIQDDILGVYGNEKLTGKSNTSDISEGKMTLLRLYLDKLGNSVQKDMQKKLMLKKYITTKESDEYQAAIAKSGVLKTIKTLAEEYVKKGVNQIPYITDNTKLQQLLKSLLCFMIERYQ